MPRLITWGVGWYGSLGNGAPATPLVKQPTPAVAPTTLAGSMGVSWRPIGGSDSPSHGFLHEGISVPNIGWGWDAYSQVQPTHLPFGTPYDNARAVLTPEYITSDVGLAMACGSYHTILVGNVGTLYAWGNNDHGQCGQDHITYPIASGARIGDAAFDGFVDVTAGEAASFALRAGATAPGVYGCGRMADPGGGTAYSANSLLDSDVPILLPSQPSDVLALSKPGGGAPVWFAISGAARLVWGWGYNRYGAVGNGESFTAGTGLLYVFAPVAVLGVGGSGQLSGAVMVSSAFDHACALMDDGSLVAWGEGIDATGGDSLYPVLLPAAPAPVVDMVVSTGAVHIVCSDGSVWGRGYNGDGQLGIGVVDSTFHPAWERTLGIVAATKIAASWSSLFCIGELGAVRRAFPSQHLG